MPSNRKKPPRNTQVEIIRSTFANGERVSVGDVVTVTSRDANLLCGGHTPVGRKHVPGQAPPAKKKTSRAKPVVDATR